ncbi:uncharacterized protein LOC110240950 [Exaiptasia diaphana]|uniref:DOMON domain-containing protein n=1 Tax=Exaiptasia diaphana TaxID=2652724 RepID=A0A913XCP0_EXADI|nr:uncharacterized protein LOC110240950 [Exaiptasia diaphana]
MKTVTFLVILGLLCLSIDGMQYEHHLVLKSGVFDVYWTVNTSMIPNTVYFKYVAKTTGWAALGWSKTASGGQMIQYDIALGGVRNTNESYLKDYYSSTLGKPTYDDDVRQNLILTSATESGGFTTIEFNRETDTGDTGYDVPIQNGTKTWIMWGLNPKDATDANTFAKHTEKGYTSLPYNMFTGKQFSSTTAQPKTTSGSQATSVKIMLAFAAILLVQLGSVLMLH